MTNVSMSCVGFISLTPGLSRVCDALLDGNRFSGFLARVETVETVSDFRLPRFTGLKRGVNETAY